MTIPTKTYLLIILFQIFLFGKKTNAQDCTLPQAQKVLHSKNLSVNILNGGDLFWDRSDAYFQTNPDDPTPVSSIFNAGIWIGAFTGLPDNPILKVAATTYNSPTSNDYSAGPLSDIGTVQFDTCSNYDKLWEVYGSEIKNHIEDFAEDGIINNPQANIYQYPGYGNPHFLTFNGFELPEDRQEFAPYYDNNTDGLYNPDQGDYPLPSSVHKDHYPGHMIWGVFNDAGKNHTLSGGDVLRVEIQLTAWAFSCNDNQILNNSIFTSHKIINWALDPLDSMYVGMFVDFDLGCYTDDYVGCIPDLNTFYSYNSDEIDGTNGSACNGGVSTFASDPPVQAVTYLNQNMSSFTTTAPAGTTASLNNFPAGYFNLLSGSWYDGVPLTAGGNGYNSGAQPTSFIFPDNPNDPNGWSMTTESIADGDFRALSSVHLDEMSYTSVETIDMAYTFYQDETLNNLETVDLVYLNTPEVQQIYDSKFEMACDHLYLPNENLESSTIEIFPNPTSDILNVKMEITSSANFSIFDIYGKRVFEKTEVNQNEIQLSTSSFSSGVYFIKMEMEGKELVKKFIKL